MERITCAQICRRITDKQLVCTCHSFYISPLGCAITVPITWLKVFWNVIKLWDHCDRTRLFWAKNGKILRWNTQLQLDSLIWLSHMAMVESWGINMQNKRHWVATGLIQYGTQPESTSEIPVVYPHWSVIGVESDYVPSSSSYSAFQEIYPKGISDIPNVHCTLVTLVLGRALHGCGRSNASQQSIIPVSASWSWLPEGTRVPSTLQFYRWLASNTALHSPTMFLFNWIYIYIYIHICIYIYDTFTVTVPWSWEHPAIEHHFSPSDPILLPACNTSCLSKICPAARPDPRQGLHWEHPGTPPSYGKLQAPKKDRHSIFFPMGDKSRVSIFFMCICFLGLL
jgi:hypothetical protein